MNGRVSNILKTYAKWALYTSAAVFVLGLCWIIAAAPCSDVGAYVLFSSVALTALSACALIVRALVLRTVASVGLGFGIALLGAFQYFVFDFTALMLCRGV